MQNKNIIAIDDDPNILDLFKYIFIENPGNEENFEDISFYTGEDFNICLAQNGPAGFEAVKKGYEQGLYYTTAFIDIRMPDWNGIKTGKEIRKIDDKIYIVLITGYDVDSINDIQQELKHDVFFIHKPFDEFELYQMGRNLKNTWNRSIKLREANPTNEYYTKGLKTIKSKDDKEDLYKPETKKLSTQQFHLSSNNHLISTLPNKYKIIEQIDEGGMANIYKARQKTLERIVALKILSSHGKNDTCLIKRFQKEARIAASLNHKNIITIYDVGSKGDLYYISMEYLEGQDLKEILRTDGPFSENKIREIIKPTAEGLDLAHRNGLIHRDIKSSNIFIDKNQRPVLMDFGIAKTKNRTQNLTKEDEILGTPEYMSPEQVRGNEISHHSDIYSLGVVMYEMATGELPFKSKTMMGTLKKISESNPTPPKKINPQISNELNSIILNCMQKSSHDRPQRAKNIFAVKQATKIYNSKISEYISGIGFIVFLAISLFWMKQDNFFNHNGNNKSNNLANQTQALDTNRHETKLSQLQKGKIRNMIKDARKSRKQDKLEEATEIYRKLLKIDSSNYLAQQALDTIYQQLNRRANKYFEKGNLDKYYQLHKKAIELFPENKLNNLHILAHQYYSSGILFSQNNQNALILYHKIIESNPNAQLARSRIEQVITKVTNKYFRNQNYKEFQSISRDLVQYYPGSQAKLYNTWGDKYYTEGRLLTIDSYDAIHMYKKALQTDPDNKYAQKRLEAINYDLKKYIPRIEKPEQRLKIARLAKKYFPETQKYKNIISQSIK